MRALALALALLLLPCLGHTARTLSVDQRLAIRLDLAQPTAIALPEPVASVTVQGLIGMVLTVQNTQATSLAIDVRIGTVSEAPAEPTLALSTWTWPPKMTIKAVASEADVLAPEQQTRLFVVLEKRL
jgi:hypothetical protein